MRIEYHSIDKLSEFAERPDVLGVITYGTVPRWTGKAPVAALSLRPEGPALCEVIQGAQAMYGQDRGVCYGHDGQWLFATITVREPGGLRAAAMDAYRDILAVIGSLGYPCLIRAWQYFPDIHVCEEGLERYRQFNKGRHQAFEPYFAQGGLRPAATCIGGAGPGLSIYVLAQKSPGVAIENPRQMAAYRYPVVYGPQAPDFVRAMKVEAHEGALLWISGTAAIVGHESQGIGDFDRQVQETFANLDAVLARADLGPHPEIMATKIYVRKPQSLKEVPAPWRQSATVILEGDICRAELDIEVEAVVREDPLRITALRTAGS